MTQVGDAIVIILVCAVLLGVAVWAVIKSEGPPPTDDDATLNTRGPDD